VPEVVRDDYDAVAATQWEDQILDDPLASGSSALHGPC
jgi:hypothetical protein